MRSLVLCLSALLLCARVQATPLITVEDKEWLQPVSFVGLEWSEVAALCNPSSGVCSGSLNGIALDDWTWASSQDIFDLFNSYIGSTLLNSFRKFLGFTDDLSLRHLDIVDFDPELAGFGVDFLADGWISTGISPFIGLEGVSGYVAGSIGERGSLVATPPTESTRTSFALLDTAGSFPFTGLTPPTGAWFYRASGEVDSPGPLPLLLLGVTLLLGVRLRTN